MTLDALAEGQADGFIVDHFPRFGQTRLIFAGEGVVVDERLIHRPHRDDGRQLVACLRIERDRFATLCHCQRVGNGGNREAGWGLRGMYRDTGIVSGAGVDVRCGCGGLGGLLAVSCGLLLFFACSAHRKQKDESQYKCDRSFHCLIYLFSFLSRRCQTAVVFTETDGTRSGDRAKPRAAPATAQNRPALRWGSAGRTGSQAWG